MTEPNTTDRGFRNFSPLVAKKGGGFRVIESSLADSPHLLLIVTSHLRCPPWPLGAQPLHADVPEANDSSVLLSLDEATELRDQLDWMINNHHHLDPKDPA